MRLHFCLFFKIKGGQPKKTSSRIKSKPKKLKSGQKVEVGKSFQIDNRQSKHDISSSSQSDCAQSETCRDFVHNSPSHSHIPSPRLDSVVKETSTSQSMYRRSEGTTAESLAFIKTDDTSYDDNDNGDWEFDDKANKSKRGRRSEEKSLGESFTLSDFKLLTSFLLIFL